MYPNYTNTPEVVAKDYVLVTNTNSIAPAIELAYVKENSKLDGNSFDSLLLSLIKVATEFGERITGRDFINKTYKGFLDCFPGDCNSIQITKSKLQSITSIQYLKDNVLTTFDASKYYITESDNDFSTINLVYGQSWPTNEDNRKQAVIITFVAGYGDDSCDIPETLKRAMAAHIELLRSNSGDCQGADGINKQATQLYKIFVLARKRFCVT